MFEVPYETFEVFAKLAALVFCKIVFGVLLIPSGGREVATAYAVVAATAVLPLPTSPSRRRDIGCLPLKSVSMSSMDFFWALVSGKGNREVKASICFLSVTTT